MGITWMGTHNGCKAGVWQHFKRKRKLTGEWKYVGGNKFIIYLDKKDSDTGRYKVIEVYGDTPEWDDWKLIKDK